MRYSIFLMGFLFSSLSYSLSDFKINNTLLHVDIVSTEASRAEGLSGRESLAPDQGMLFVFPEEGYYSFWMKDMRFPIDIIWMDKNLNIVYVVKNAPPCGLLSCPDYTPTKPAQYVLETLPGTVQGI